MSRPNLKFQIFGECWGSVIFLPGKIWNLKFMVGGLVHLCMSRLNPKFKIFGEDGVSVIFSCPGQIWNFKTFQWGWRVSHLSISRQNLKFKSFQWGLGVGHLTMSRSNLKLKFLGRVGGQSFFSCQANLKFKIYGEGGGLGPNLKFKNYIAGLGVQANLKFKIFGEDGGSVIFPCPGQIWNLKMFSESLGLVIFHTQSKSEI